MTGKRRMTASTERLETVEDSPKLTLPVTEKRDHIQGSSTAKVVLVEYGDYQCPFCGEAYPIIKKIQKEYGKDLKFVFRNFPLTQIHPRAEFGAELAEAAGLQGKFWEMHDFIYENQKSLDDEEFFLKYADKKLGLDKEKIRQSVAQHALAPRIREDFMSGVRSGVNGTPTLFVQEHRHNGSYEYKELNDAIKSALGSKS
jgi:protein-disulfide isomerase